MRKLFYLLPVALLTLTFFSCRKDAPQPSISIIGQWRFLNAVGGFTGKQVISPRGNEIYTFKADSTFIRLRNDTVLRQGSFHILPVKSIFTGDMRSALLLNMAGYLDAASAQLITISKDTLVITDNHVEPYAYSFVRVYTK